MKATKNFASDNNAGVHPAILNALTKMDNSYTYAYGDDDYTAKATNTFKTHFGPDIEVFFVYNETAANVLGLKAITNSYHAVIAPETAHINVDECGAVECFTGCKIITVPTPDGKIKVEQIAAQLGAIGNQHHNQPKVVSVSQATEYGTVYSVEEIKQLADFAHANGMYLHMDGARIANAAASLGVSLKVLAGDAGVDVLSFGGTKNGLMYGEAIIFFNQRLAEGIKFLRKQGMQLASKMRYIAIQFDTLLKDNLWLENARNANQMAQLLASELAKVPQIKITQKVEANAVFAIIPPQYVPKIQEHYYFYIWNQQTSEARLMCSFDTTAEDILAFVKVVRDVIG